MYSYTDDLELEHYGILGMKWGVRRTPEQLGHPRKNKKLKYNPWNEIHDYDKDISLPIGTKTYRVQVTPTIRESPIYLSANKEDHIQYLSTALTTPEYGIAVDSKNSERAVAGKPQNTYSIELTAKEPIRAPSYQEAIKTYVEMIGDVGIDKLNPYSKECSKGQKYINSWKNRGKSSEGPAYAYTRFVSVVMQKPNSKAYKEFQIRLKNKGYNALIDPEDYPRILYKDIKDRRTYQMFKAPMIVLDPQKTLEISRSRKLTPADQTYLMLNYSMDDGNPKYVDKFSDRFSKEQKKTHEKWKRWFNE